MARARKKMDHQKMVEAVAAGTKKYLRYDEAAELYSVGVNTIKKWAHDAGAVQMAHPIGRFCGAKRSRCVASGRT